MVRRRCELDIPAILVGKRVRFEGILRQPKVTRVPTDIRWSNGACQRLAPTKRRFRRGESLTRPRWKLQYKAHYARNLISLNLVSDQPNIRSCAHRRRCPGRRARMPS